LIVWNAQGPGNDDGPLSVQEGSLHTCKYSTLSGSDNVTKRAATYKRVSQEEQALGNAVSLEQQKREIQGLCRDYRATRKPRKGKMTNPSGTRDDRPGLLAMLDHVRTGDVDVIICWRSDRLYRHERVVTAIKDAIEEGEEARQGREIEVMAATGQLNKDLMYLEAMISRKDNEARAERTRIGKIGTLQDGRWPGVLTCLGYRAIREKGERGRRILLADDDEVQTVRDIFEWYAAGASLMEIRGRLIARGDRQLREPPKHQWPKAVILKVVTNRTYTGRLTWTFKGGDAYAIEIPPIVSEDLFEICQQRTSQNKTRSRRNSRGVYLLQGLVECECGYSVNVRRLNWHYDVLADGTRKRYPRKTPGHSYYCPKPDMYPEEAHPARRHWGGPTLDDAVWRHLVDFGIKRPEVIAEQTRARQEELRDQGEQLEGDIGRARARLDEIQQARLYYFKEAGYGRMDKATLDALLADADRDHTYWQGEVERLCELRDDQAKIEAGLDYTRELMTKISARLDAIDQDRETLRAMGPAERAQILRERQRIIRLLCDRIVATLRRCDILRSRSRASLRPGGCTSSCNSRPG